MSWVFVITAGLLEVIGVTGIAQLNKRASITSYAMIVGGFVSSFLLLSLAMQHMAMGTAYAVWTGIGTIGSALVGILFYRDSKSLLRIFFILLILSAVIGLKLTE